MAKSTKKTLDDRIAQIEPHWTPGMSRSQLMKATGLSHQSLYNIYREHPEIVERFPLVSRMVWWDRDMSDLSPSLRDVFEQAAASKLHLRQIAERCGIHEFSLSAYVNGRVQPSMKSFDKLRHAVEELINEQG